MCRFWTRRTAQLHRRRLRRGRLVVRRLRPHLSEPGWRRRRRRLGERDVDQVLNRLAGMRDVDVQSRKNCYCQRRLNDNDRGKRKSALPRPYVRFTLRVGGHASARLCLAVVAAPGRRRRAIDRTARDRTAHRAGSSAEEAAADQAVADNGAGNAAGN